MFIIEKEKSNIPKLFISYVREDKSIVSEFLEKLREGGLHFYFYTFEVDTEYQNIEKVMKFLFECDVAIVFLSENTIPVKREINIIFENTIVYAKRIIPIQLDNIEPDKIIFGLSGYKYVDYNNQSEMEQLLQRLIQKYT